MSLRQVWMTIDGLSEPLGLTVPWVLRGEGGVETPQKKTTTLQESL